MAGARVVAVLCATLVGTAVGEAADTVARIAVIVGLHSPLASIDVDTLRDLYLRRQRLWKSGVRAAPVNLPADDPCRHAFSRRVLGRSPRSLSGYWNARWFEGIRPPLVLRSPEAVCAYVDGEAGGIGYVPADRMPSGPCRVLLMLEER